ncbi:uncharacterized protein BO80DRAFT_444247 [Aspergillus ibericus CBS 121593]|uniref:Uncharacterized protein n=1 Tax=Aspergillus ibericus CBS 121593 TaxID=1448316 RepID=A0A395H3I9_9EURO|nr:hypothetical protein BO80DRAFT_444247 [Aspergillus ibericus CBS 121593]RAL01999.1 hypothetical protein BO80DRAFT_444247 [Aspergillus ibericus CBS 121593]
MAGRTPGESGDLDRPISRVATPVYSEDGHSQDNNRGTMPVKLPKVSFEELAVRYRQNQHKQTSRKRLEHRLHALKVSMGVSARFVRVGSIVQRGLVDRLKHDDKASFIALYHTLGDLQESCESAFRRHFHRQDPLEEWSPIRESAVDRSPDFFLQLSPQSRTDLLDILHLVRTDPQFILERLRSLTPTQLAALVSSTGPSGEPGDMSFPSTSRSRTHSSLSKRSASSLLFKDRALNFERTDPLSTVLFNVYASPLDSDAPEAQLRLDVWSSVCAKLIADGGNKYDPLLGHILGSWATSSEWKAKPKFELYLMDVLQTGSFLLEHVEAPPGMSYGAEPPDPLRTEVAEEFFASAVDDLFQLLDDPDGGLPHGVMQLSNAVLQKLDRQDGRARFLEFLFVQWFFSKFLYGALTYPEAHGLLLDFHIRNDAREKLLGQVGFRAYSQVYAILHSMHHYSMVRSAVRRHVENMLCRFSNTKSDKNVDVQSFSRAKPTTGRESPAAFLMLSATDILTLLNALFPRTLASACSSPLSSSGVPSPVGSLAARSDRSIASIIEPGFFKPVTDSIPIRVPQDRTIFATEMAFLSSPENCMSRNADRIRFELSDLSEPDGRTTLEPPAGEEWTIFSMTQNGRRLTWGLFPDTGQFSFPENASVDDVQPTTLGMEDNFEALQTAIVKLIQDHPADDGAEYDLLDLHDSSRGGVLSLKQRFDMAMKHCHHDSDFIGAHYWWNAGRQLLRSVANSPSRLADDSWILEPMHASCVRSLATSRAVIDRCETDFVALNRHMQRLQRAVKDTMATMAKLRDKMWYMTDVKNSMRYEDAKNVALALKTMARSANPTPNEGRSRSRPFGSSLLQKPELQVMNIMKAPSSQGPNKLSDEQVDLIRKWLSHNTIDNFCKGEERIHRFCYEVKTSINRLVGETMAETPVLWASELYHKERAMYEGSSNRNFLSLSSSLRPFNVSSDDSAYSSQTHANTARPPNTVSKFSQDLPPLNPKSSFQSLISDKWRGPREPSIADASSIGGSPGRAASTTTGDSYSTFWSTPHQPAHYAPSASSLYSRPPSMFSDNGAQPSRRNGRKAHSKMAFLEDLKQTLTSLLLSDLGSPVWSCGSETDAWFGGKLTDERIQTQMRKRARIQQFYAESDERLVHHTINRTPSDRRRSRSLEPSDRATPGDAENACPSTTENPMEPNDTHQFSYDSVFRRLLEVFSRHGNPCVKLKALRDLRALVVASLNSENDDACHFNATEPPRPRGRTPGSRVKRSARHSFSESQAKRSHGQDISHTPTSPAAESVIFDSRPSDYCAPTENQIVDALRSLLMEVKPKTLFRDLQFISAFVPGETLNKTDSGTAFLQFGLAALSLKDEVCNSMVEIADNIVSQEFSRRHLPGSEQAPRPGNTLLDAAKMWIITAKEGNPVAQRELAILYLTHPELLPPVTLPLTLMRDTYKAEMMYRRDKDSKSDPQSMCLALHWMQLSANGGDELARNRLREREEFESIA